ncbi:hypothetical protein quinque_007939 [Culex quinquefasciatus]
MNVNSDNPGKNIYRTQSRYIPRNGQHRARGGSPVRRTAAVHLQRSAATTQVVEATNRNVLWVWRQAGHVQRNESHRTMATYLLVMLYRCMCTRNYAE